MIAPGMMQESNPPQQPFIILEREGSSLEGSATRLQLYKLLLAKVVGLLGEGEIKDVCDVVLEHPCQVLEVLWVNSLDVLHTAAAETSG